MLRYSSQIPIWNNFICGIECQVEQARTDQAGQAGQAAQVKQGRQTSRQAGRAMLRALVRLLDGYVLISDAKRCELCRSSSEMTYYANSWAGQPSDL